MEYVWPDPKGKTMGLLIEPLYQNQTKAVILDENFYYLMALTDLIRVGKTREINHAIDQLKQTILE